MVFTPLSVGADHGNSFSSRGHLRSSHVATLFCRFRANSYNMKHGYDSSQIKHCQALFSFCTGAKRSPQSYTQISYAILLTSLHLLPNFFSVGIYSEWYTIKYEHMLDKTCTKSGHRIIKYDMVSDIVMSHVGYYECYPLFSVARGDWR